MLRYNNRSCQVFFLALKTNRKASQIPLQDLSSGEVFFGSIYVIEKQKEIACNEDWITKNFVVKNVDFGLGPGTIDITLHNSDESFKKSGETFYNDLDNQTMEGVEV